MGKLLMKKNNNSSKKDETRPLLLKAEEESEEEENYFFNKNELQGKLQMINNNNSYKKVETLVPPILEEDSSHKKAETLSVSEEDKKENYFPSPIINNNSHKKAETLSILEEEEEEDNYFSASEEEEILSDYYEAEDSFYVCQICFESNSLYDSFEVKGCSHFYCTECIINYIKSKLEDNVTLIPCPDVNCEGRLDPDFCREILPLSLFYRWGTALCESAVTSHEKFYCPYKDCSALLIKDDHQLLLNEGLTNFLCPICNRNFCLQCK
ncbi:Zinc finger, RING/FYVE/PHD-type, partial [Corchorus capsularis]